MQVLAALLSHNQSIEARSLRFRIASDNELGNPVQAVLDPGSVLLGPRGDKRAFRLATIPLARARPKATMRRGMGVSSGTSSGHPQYENGCIVELFHTR